MYLSDLFSRRRTQLREEMQAVGMIGVVISRTEHIYYLTGYEANSSATFLIMNEADEILIAPQNIEDFKSDISLVGYDLSPMEGRLSAQSAITKSISCAFDRLRLNNKDVGIEVTH